MDDLAFYTISSARSSILHFSVHQVTLIHHLEPYGISPDELAHTVQVAMACSTSVSQLPGKGAGTEVLVQGNQVHYVYQLLTGERIKGTLYTNYLRGETEPNVGTQYEFTSCTDKVHKKGRGGGAYLRLYS